MLPGLLPSLSVVLVHPVLWATQVPSGISSELSLVIGASSPEQHLLSPELPSIFPEERYHDRGNLYSLHLRLLLQRRA